MTWWEFILFYAGIGGLHGKWYLDETEPDPGLTYRQNRWRHAMLYLISTLFWPFVVVFAYVLIPFNIRSMLK